MAQRCAIRANLLDYLDDPSGNPQAVRVLEDGVLIVEDGTIVARGPRRPLLERYRGITVHDHRDHWLLPGFIDAHVHYPQTPMIAAHGNQLLEWLNQYTFPTESRFADANYAEVVADAFLDELLRNGTTTALTLCTVYPQSVDALAQAALRREMRLILGKVMMDRNVPEALQDTPESSYRDSLELIQRWHERGRLSYAVSPRFAVSSSPQQLSAAARLLEQCPSVYLHTHLSENQEEVAWVERLFPQHASYTDVYRAFGLLTSRSLFAHGVHLSDVELAQLADAGSTLIFCPSANLFLGSGLFPLARVRRAGVRVALGTDVGAGTSFSLLRTLADAYKVLQLQRQSLSAHAGLYWITLGAAHALHLEATLGNLEPGKEADFVLLNPRATPLLELRSRNAADLEELLFAVMTLGDDRVVEATYVAGKRVAERARAPRSAAASALEKARGE